MKLGSWHPDPSGGFRIRTTDFRAPENAGVSPRDCRLSRTGTAASHFVATNALSENSRSLFRSGGRNRLALRSDLYYLVPCDFAACRALSPRNGTSFAFYHPLEPLRSLLSRTDFSPTLHELVPAHESAIKRGKCRGTTFPENVASVCQQRSRESQRRASNSSSLQSSLPEYAQRYQARPLSPQERSGRSVVFTVDQARAHLRRDRKAL